MAHSDEIWKGLNPNKEPTTTTKSPNWSKPIENCLNLKIDISYIVETGILGIGYSPRNDKGEFVVAGTNKTEASGAEGECLGIFRATPWVFKVIQYNTDFASTTLQNPPI